MTYLKKYGYIENIRELTLGEVHDGLVKLQGLAGLITDGELGPKTLRVMNTPRCACPDYYNDGHDFEVASMETLSNKWGRKNLSYFIEKRDNDLSAQEWDEAIEKAFTQWSDVAGLKFTRSNSRSNANFIMSIGAGRRDQFDGPGGTLAWAQLPPGNSFNGQLLCRFDEAETWVLNRNQRGVLLVNVACHEIGHLLGLRHSNVQTALMAPFYSPGVTKPQLKDDVTRIQRLYGRPTGGGDVDPPEPTPPEKLAAPSNLEATAISSSEVSLSWVDNSTGEDIFEVYRNNIYQGGVGRGRTSATDIKVPQGNHVYKIRAKKGDVKSDWSNTAEVSVGEETVPPEPGPEPTPDEELVINITGDIKNISIPGYRVNKIG